MMKPIGPRINSSIPHKTSPIRPHDIPSLASAVAAIKKYLVDWNEWVLITRDGSLTLQRKSDSRLVLKVFVDVNAALTKKVALQAPKHLQNPDNLIVGIELTHLDPYFSDAIRDRLKADFQDQYCDPRSGSTKVWLQPITEHSYDILIIPDGQNCLKVSGSEIDEITNMIASFNLPKTD